MVVVFEIMKSVLSVVLFFTASVLSAHTKEVLRGQLSQNKIISSKILGYDLQYRVYIPEGYDGLSNLPVIFLTDGQWYIEGGEMPRKLDEMIYKREIKPVVAVFVDARDPKNLDKNRRNQQFLGNEKYVDFYRKELIPSIQRNYKVSRRQKNRAIMGLSFGGLNATFFGAKASDTFHMLGIQSPALHPVKNIYDLYRDQEKLPLKIFLTTGTVNDTEIPARKLKKTLEDKGYKFEYIEVAEGHNWMNWKPLINKALLYFFGW